MWWDNKREELDDLHLEEGFPASSAQDSDAPISFSDDVKCLPERDTEAPHSSNERSLFAWAVGGSLLLHAGMLAALFSFRMTDRAVATLEPENNSLIESIAVRFVTQNPLRAEQADAESSGQQSAGQLPEEVEQVLPTDSAVEQVVELESDSVIETSSEEVIAETIVAEEAEATPSRLVPSISAVRSSIQQVNEQRRSRDWMQQCNPLEEDVQLLECGESEEPDYSAANRNATYLVLNPTFTQTREQRSISTIALQRETLLKQLEEADLPQWLKEYARQEMEISISDQSRFFNPTVDQIHQMTEKGDAAARARMMFGDAWLLDTVRREIQQNVHRENTPGRQ